MKMKSNVFGQSAKLALAVLTVCGGLFTSCYEKEDVDAPNLGDPEYYIAGTITDANTGHLITNATVTVGGTSVAATTGSFKSANLMTYTASAIPVTVTLAGYTTFTKQVYLSKVTNGAIYIADASVALFPAGTPVVPAQIVALSPNAVEAAKAAIPNPSLVLKGEGTGAITISGITKTSTATAVLLQYDAAFTNKIASGYVDYISYNGYNVAGAVTRADATSSQTAIFKASVTALTGLTEGMTQKAFSAFLSPIASYTIGGYRAVNNMAVVTCQAAIDGDIVTGSILYQTGITIYTAFQSHNGHNVHGHGFSPNAGGGSGN